MARRPLFHLPTWLLWPWMLVRALWFVLRMAFRYVSGRPMDGVARTDASMHFFRKGTKVLTSDGVASRWAMMPGWKRSAWRIGAPVTFMSTGWAYAEAPVLTGSTLATIASAAGIQTTRRARRALRTRHVRREYIVPTAATLAKLLDQDPARADEWLHIPAELVDANRPGLLDRVSLPSWVRTPMPIIRVVRLVHRAEAFVAARWAKMRGKMERPTDQALIRYPIDTIVTDELRKQVTTTLNMKLGGEDWTITWHGKGSAPYIAVKATPRPPSLVTWAEVEDLVNEQGNDSAPFLGMTAHGPLRLDLDTDAPHLAASCGTGSGKSILFRFILAQLLHHGVQVVILDAKRTSQRWCKDLPGVRYCRTGEEMHNVLMELEVEGDRRFTLIDSVPADSDEMPNVGARILVLFEEQNVGMQQLTEYWQRIKVKGDPNRSPAMSALDRLLLTGREARMHVMSVAQLFTVQATGGNPAARANYGPRILARADRNGWLMLAPEYAPFPKQSKRRGRMHLAFDGDLTEFQVPLLSVSEARKLATTGAAVTVPAEWSATTDLRHRGAAVTGERLMTLADLAREKVVPLAYGSLRNAKAEGNPPFPEAVMVNGQAKYRPADVKAWYATREEAKSAGTK